jgi:hypothetical protein
MRTRNKVLLGAGGVLVLVEIGAVTAGFTGQQHAVTRMVPIPAIIMPYIRPVGPGPAMRPAPVPGTGERRPGRPAHAPYR